MKSYYPKYVKNAYSPIAKNHTTQWKNRQRTRRDASPRKTCRRPSGTQEMLHIPHHRGNANQNHSEVPLTPARAALSKRHEVANARKDVAKRDFARCWRDCKQGSHLGNGTEGPPKKSKVKLRAGVLRGLHPKEAEPLPCRDTCTTGFTTVLFILDEILKQPVSIGGGKDKAVHRYMHVHPKREKKREGSTIQPKKRMKFYPA